MLLSKRSESVRTVKRECRASKSDCGQDEGQGARVPGDEHGEMGGVQDHGGRGEREGRGAKVRTGRPAIPGMEIGVDKKKRTKGAVAVRASFVSDGASILLVTTLQVSSGLSD